MLESHGFQFPDTGEQYSTVMRQGKRMHFGKNQPPENKTSGLLHRLTAEPLDLLQPFSPLCRVKAEI